MTYVSWEDKMVKEMCGEHLMHARDDDARISLSELTRIVLQECDDSIDPFELKREDIEALCAIEHRSFYSKPGDDSVDF